jgi:FAD synthetase
MNIIVDEKIYPGMGTYFKEKQLLEAHLFDVELDLYDKDITVYPLLKTRNNTTFTNLDELIKAIKQDEHTIRNINWTVLTFGTFDHLHPGHLAYLMQAKAYGDTLVTIIALDETVKRVKDFYPDASESQRQLDVQWLGITSHIVQLGNNTNVYHCLDEWQPEVIYLGYDQQSFDTGIIKYYTW